MYHFLKVWEADSILYVVLNNPRNENRLDANLSQELKMVAQELSLNDTVKVVVLGASGANFSLGTNLNLPDESSVDEAYSEITLASDAIEEWAKIPHPVIAAINGQCFSLGLSLASVADLRYASENSQFSVPEIQYGLVPAGGITNRLPRLIGKGPAMAMLLRGEVINAEYALQFGLVNKLTPENSLWTEACLEGERLAKLSNLSMQYTKECLLRGSELPFDQALRLELDVYMLLQTSTDRLEGVHAFIDKREPNFIGE